MTLLSYLITIRFVPFRSHSEIDTWKKLTPLTHAGYIILVTRPDLRSLDDPAYVDFVLASKISY
jgi:hypothetical protein